MREIIGQCQSCGENVYCENGFFNGVQTEEGKLLCNDCDVKTANEGKK